MLTLCTNSMASKLTHVAFWCRCVCILWDLAFVSSGVCCLPAARDSWHPTRTCRSLLALRAPPEMPCRCCFAMQFKRRNVTGLRALVLWLSTYLAGAVATTRPAQQARHRPCKLRQLRQLPLASLSAQKLPLYCCACTGCHFQLLELNVTWFQYLLYRTANNCMGCNLGL